ncbi:hypothetical protein TNCV_800571 [Trichonephila clavipes]|nr:hypothetical protein TNCV_800571 [Trichonephila clavipes]
MPIYFTMVVNLSLSNCRLLAFRRMATIQKLFASRWTTRISLRLPKTAGPTGTSMNGSGLRATFPDLYLSSTCLSASGASCHLAEGNRGLIVVKGSDQRKIFEKLGLFTINLEILPHFQDLNDRTLPDHLHDEVHEDFDISECTMVKSYRFARYLQHFNKLQAECKRQTAHLVE